MTFPRRVFCDNVMQRHGDAVAFPPITIRQLFYVIVYVYSGKNKRYAYGDQRTVNPSRSGQLVRQHALFSAVRRFPLSAVCCPGSRRNKKIRAEAIGRWLAAGLRRSTGAR